MILVTGGAGFIGSVLTPLLLNKGFSVKVFDKLWFGSDSLREHIDKIDLVQGDIRQIESEHLDGIDSIVHLAGLSNDPMANFNPKANHEINCLATIELAKKAKERGVKRFIFASSCSIYDLGFHAPDFLRTEESEVEPRAAYAVSKYEAEQGLKALSDSSFEVVILRLGTVYGYSPRVRFDLVVNTFVKDALLHGKINVDCGGEMWRPLVCVADVASAMLYCLEASSDQIKGQLFNLVYKNYRILELAHWAREALSGFKEIDIHVDYSHFQARSYRASAEKISKELGFKPSVSVKDSIEEMLKNLKTSQPSDLLHAKHYNIQWLKLLTEVEGLLKNIGQVF